MARTSAGLILASLLLTACSSARPKDQFPDGGRHFDISVGSDLSGPPVDHGGPGVDQGAPAACQQQCTSQADWLCVMDPATNFCVECLNDGHCAYNIGSAGGTCDTKTNLCSCAAGADCVGKVLGKLCHANDLVCSCKSDTDCPGGRKCIGNFFGAKVCKPPCTTDADCAGQLFNKVCDLKTGCQECTKSTQCGPTSLGKACTNGLCSCSGNTDCAANENGKTCLSDISLCGCETDFDCPTGRSCTGQYQGAKLCK
jgi:hypothetical protein